MTEGGEAWSEEGEVLEGDNPVWDLLLKAGQVYKLAGGDSGARKTLLSRADRDLRQLLTSLAPGTVTSEQEEVSAYQAWSLTHGLQHVVTVTRGRGLQSFLMTARLGPVYCQELTVHGQFDAVLRTVGATQTQDDADTEQQQQASSSSSGDDLLTYLDAQRHGRNVTSSWPDLHLLVPLLNRHNTYLRFLQHLNNAASRYHGNVFLRVGLYANTTDDVTQVERVSGEYRGVKTTVVRMQGPFSRAAALASLARYLPPEAILVFMDVDVVLTAGFLQRAASLVAGGRAYFPICFSQFSPRSVCYPRPDCPTPPSDLSPDAGSWRAYGFGLLAISRHDLARAGGINKAMVGWGGEDVDFYKRCIKARLDIVRAPDPGLVHVYHEQWCSLALSPTQKQACNNSRCALFGSTRQLASMWSDIEKRMNSTIQTASHNSQRYPTTPTEGR